MPCGNIITPIDYSYEGSEEYVDPISDCTNPFGRTGDLTTFELQNQAVTNNATYSIDEGGTSDYGFAGETYNNRIGADYYLHSGNDYIRVKTEFEQPTQSAFEAEIPNFFNGNQSQINYYTNVYNASDRLPYFLVSDNPRVYRLDPFDSSKRVVEVFDEMEQYIQENAKSNRPLLLPGTYTVTLVDTDEGFFPTYEKSIIERLFAKIIPTAQAYYYVNTVTFTLAGPTPEPTGASSVLFLPGIQASRLYINPIILNEDQIWPPNSAFNNDIRDLSMNLSGVSDKNVYTRDIIDSTAGAGDIYKNFSRFMNQLDSDNKIESWKPYAYDWRYGVKDVANNGTLYETGIKDAIEEIESLAENSFTDKVTIIGHSNGGLLAKAIMIRLEAEGKSNLIDKIILLASPQLGTPKSIGTILHGYDQTDAIGGILMDGQVVRKVLNNMPGAYGLLPSSKYFEGLSEPIVTFNENSTTLPYRNIYNSSISSYANMVRFVKGDDGLDRDLDNPISKPARTNVTLLENALSEHTDLDNWRAPTGVEVIEIVGTGLPTMKAVEYREITENKCASAGPAGPVCVIESEIKPYARLTHYGDGTVVQRSAEAYEGEKKKFFVNLDALEKSSLAGEFVHHNISEAPPVQDLLLDLIIGTTTKNNEFVSTEYTVFNDQYDVEIIDSPVRLLATDSNGRQTGVIIVNGIRTIKEEIPGSQYFEFGDTKYFVVPKGTNRTTKLYGEANGGYTLTTITFGANDSQTINTVLKNATTTPLMVAEYKNTNSQYSNLTTDSNGDGIIDLTTNMIGEQVIIATYPLLISKIQSLTLSKPYKQALLLLINSAQVYANKTNQVTLNKRIERGLLTTAEELVKLYIKKGYINQTDGQYLLQTVVLIKNKK
jgi:pimeloyl-ACP methyl ester carboxylesterase